MTKNNTNNNSTAATNVAPKLFSFSFCNMCGLSSNINSVHHHLQYINPYALFLTEKKSNLSIQVTALLSLLISNAQIMSYFLFFTRSDVQTLHLKQFHHSNPGFQLIWLKFSLPHTIKYICTLYSSPNSNNHGLLFDYLSK